MQRLLHVVLPSVDIPQHRHLADTGLLVRHLAHLGPPPDLSKRHLGYCRQACRVLGWLDSGEKLSAEGRHVAAAECAADSREAMDLAAQAMSRSLVYQTWMRWAGVASLEELDAETASEFVLSCSPLAGSTAKHRVGALRRWWSP